MFLDRLDKLRKIEVRLSLWHGIIFLSFSIGAFVIAYFLSATLLQENDRDNILFRLGLYSAEYERAGLNGVKEVAALRKGRSQKAFFLRIADTDNRTIYLRDAQDWTEFSPEKLSAPTLSALGSHGWRTLRSQDGDTLSIAHAILSDGYLIELGNTDEETQKLLAAIRKTTFFVIVICLPLSIFCGILVAARALQPLKRITQTATKIIEQSDLEARVCETSATNELTDLVRLFNRMLERISTLFKGMADSLDNVAHDLRTPLMRIQSRAQHALTSPSDENALKEALAECVEETQRVASLLKTLMELAETEAGLVSFSIEPLNLASLAQSAKEIYREVAEEKGVLLQTKLPERLFCLGHENSLLRILANLLDNAIKYTPPGGSVTLEGQEKDSIAQIIVRDTGIGIPPGDLPKIWERLFRGDQSGNERGLGLGLSTVRALIRALQGSITVESETGTGTSFTLLLPRPPLVGKSRL